MPWFIGIAIIALVDIFIGYRMFATNCPAPAFPEFMVLVLVPGVYLVLMYLTLKSQNGGPSR
tara:strand:- start:1917 stop:2102 length:186 start_codon:yes stop_codon:yes gene_type:complete